MVVALASGEHQEEGLSVEGDLEVAFEGALP